MKAVLVISHGSRSPNTKEEVALLITRLRSKVNVPIFHMGFLELESPTIEEGVQLCVNDGAKEIYVLLNFLNSGRHVDQDIPEIIQFCRTKYPEIQIHLSSPVGQEEGIVNLFLNMMK